MIRYLLLTCFWLSLWAESPLYVTLDETSVPKNTPFPLRPERGESISAFSATADRFHIGFYSGKYFRYTPDLSADGNLTAWKSQITLKTGGQELIFANDALYAVTSQQPFETSERLTPLSYRGPGVFSKEDIEVQKALQVGDHYIVATTVRDNAVLFLLNKEFKMMHQYEYTFSYYDAEVEDMHLLEDGTILVAGMLHASYANYRGFIMRIDINLNVLSSRVYENHGLFGNIHKETDGTYLLRFRGYKKSGVVSYRPETETLTELSSIDDINLVDMASNGTGALVGAGYRYVGEGGNRSDVPVLYCFNAKTGKTTVTTIEARNDTLQEVEYANGNFFAPYVDADASGRSILLVTVNPETCTPEKAGL